MYDRERSSTCQRLWPLFFTFLHRHFFCLSYLTLRGSTSGRLHQEQKIIERVASAVELQPLRTVTNNERGGAITWRGPCRGP